MQMLISASSHESNWNVQIGTRSKANSLQKRMRTIESVRAVNNVIELLFSLLIYSYLHNQTRWSEKSAAVFLSNEKSAAVFLGQDCGHHAASLTDNNYKIITGLWDA
jgi:hypothetical protein